MKRRRNTFPPPPRLEAQTPMPLSIPERPRPLTAHLPATDFERAPRGRGFSLNKTGAPDVLRSIGRSLGQRLRVDIPKPAMRLCAAVVSILAALTISANARADISFDGFTRFIFDGDQKQLTVTIVNEGNEQVLAQVNLGWGDKQETRDLPMAVSKPLLIIPANSKATVDILYQGTGLPSTQESFFLLSVLETPRKPTEENVVQIALQHNLKLFYRPKLPSTINDAIAKLRWTPVATAGSTEVKARNDSPYYLTLAEVGLLDQSGATCGTQVEHLMVAPFSAYDLTVTDCDKSISQVTYQFISDGGMEHPYTSPLTDSSKIRGAQL